MTVRSPSSRLRRTSPGRTACTTVIAALDQRHQNFVLQLARVRRRPSEPGIHDLRVATRRLIAVMDMVSEIVEVSSLRRRRKGLRSFLKGCNVVRDAHIQKLALSRLRPGFPVLGTVLRQMRTREAVLLRDMGKRIRAVDADGIRATIGEAEEALLRLSMNPSLVSASRVMMMGMLAEAFSRVIHRKDVLNTSEQATVHRMRVAFKKFRYTLEILAPLLPRVTADLRKQMNAYQTAMGKIQDTVVVLDGIATFERTHPISGRLALVGVRQQVLRRQRQLIQVFLAEADRVYAFWR